MFNCRQEKGYYNVFIVNVSMPLLDNRVSTSNTDITITPQINTKLPDAKTTTIETKSLAIVKNEQGQITFYRLRMHYR